MPLAPEDPNAGKTAEDLERDEREFNVPNEDTALDRESTTDEPDRRGTS